ncbi:MAG: NAD(P)-dependent oxidoreductase [Rhizobiaceae bacterium]|nr:NAD(P)-dependent oxidoreductase [Rhizobiaceae bacterium]
MSDRRLRVGFIGAGLMGHGIAKNIIEKGGYPLVTIAHRNRKPVEDLVQRGAKEVASAAQVAAQSDVVFLCLPGTEIVRETIFGENGLADELREGMIIVDTTTTFPDASQEMAGLLEKRGVAFLDAPLGRSPKEAEAGKLGCYVGGPQEAVDTVAPIIGCFAENMIRTGPVGSGGTCKILNNFITLGNCAVIAEAVAMAKRLDVDLQTLFDVVSSSGANSRMFQQMMPWSLNGDSSQLQGHLETAMKDISYYSELARRTEASSFMGSSVFEIYRYANNKGYGRSFLPVLSGIMADLNGDVVQPLDTRK